MTQSGGVHGDPGRGNLTPLRSGDEVPGVAVHAPGVMHRIGERAADLDALIAEAGDIEAAMSGVGERTAARIALLTDGNREAFDEAILRSHPARIIPIVDADALAREGLTVLEHLFAKYPFLADGIVAPISPRLHAHLQRMAG